MGRRCDRVCVSRYYPVEYMKPNRAYITCNRIMFIANGNIYLEYGTGNDSECFCCSINNFKKSGGIDILKRFMAFRGRKKKVKTINDLIDAVLECGYKRELDYFEFCEIEKESLLENSDYKHSINDLKFCEYEDLAKCRGFKRKEDSFTRMEAYHRRNDLEFYLDLGIGKIIKELPECILKEIELEANRLLEVNFVKPEDIKNTKFTCYVKVRMHHYFHYGEVTINYGQVHIGDSYHGFGRDYSIHIEIDKTSNYYNEYDLNATEMKDLKHKHLCLYDVSKEAEKAMDAFIKNQMFR